MEGDGAAGAGPADLTAALLRARVDHLVHLSQPGLRPEGSKDPGGARGLPRFGGGAGGNLHDEVERVVASRAQSANLIRELCERIRPR